MEKTKENIEDFMIQPGHDLASVDWPAGAILLIDKPLNWTSFDVVKKLRFILTKRAGVKKIKVGHAGTLDPLATGMLILCVGKMTKRIDELQGMDKEYTGTLRLGETTPSYDAETEVDKTFPFDHINETDLSHACSTFIGPIQQQPPVFSALKYKGKAMYKYARAGKEDQVERKLRSIHISSFELTQVEMPEVSFRLECSKGTYVRSLAHDFGIALKSGAYLTSLRRTKIGHLSLDDGWGLEEFITEIDKVENKTNLL